MGQVITALDFIDRSIDAWRGRLTRVVQQQGGHIESVVEMLKLFKQCKYLVSFSLYDIILTYLTWVSLLAHPVCELLVAILVLLLQIYSLFSIQ